MSDNCNEEFLVYLLTSQVVFTTRPRSHSRSRPLIIDNWQFVQ